MYGVSVKFAKIYDTSINKSIKFQRANYTILGNPESPTKSELNGVPIRFHTTTMKVCCSIRYVEVVNKPQMFETSMKTLFLDVLDARNEFSSKKYP